MASTVINTREDLDAITGTPEHSAFMLALKGSMTRRQNVQVYPEGYGKPEYDGPQLEPIWEDVEDLSAIERFGFTKDDFQRFKQDITSGAEIQDADGNVMTAEQVVEFIVTLP